MPRPDEAQRRELVPLLARRTRAMSDLQKQAAEGAEPPTVGGRSWAATGR
jgi:hypothetical protein